MAHCNTSHWASCIATSLVSHDSHMTCSTFTASTLFSFLFLILWTVPKLPSPIVPRSSKSSGSMTCKSGFRRSFSSSSSSDRSPEALPLGDEGRLCACASVCACVCVLSRRDMIGHVQCSVRGSQGHHCLWPRDTV